MPSNTVSKWKKKREFIEYYLKPHDISPDHYEDALTLILDKGMFHQNVVTYIKNLEKEGFGKDQIRTCLELVINGATLEDASNKVRQTTRQSLEGLVNEQKTKQGGLTPKQEKDLKTILKTYDLFTPANFEKAKQLVTQGVDPLNVVSRLTQNGITEKGALHPHEYINKMEAETRIKRIEEERVGSFIAFYDKPVGKRIGSIVTNSEKNKYHLGVFFLIGGEAMVIYDNKPYMLLLGLGTAQINVHNEKTFKSYYSPLDQILIDAEEGTNLIRINEVNNVKNSNPSLLLGTHGFQIKSDVITLNEKEKASLVAILRKDRGDMPSYKSEINEFKEARKLLRGMIKQDKAYKQVITEVNNHHLLLLFSSESYTLHVDEGLFNKSRNYEGTFINGFERINMYNLITNLQKLEGFISNNYTRLGKAICENPMGVLVIDERSKEIPVGIKGDSSPFEDIKNIGDLNILIQRAKERVLMTSNTKELKEMFDSVLG